jgi:type IV pilus assembly protein PilO
LSATILQKPKAAAKKGAGNGASGADRVRDLLRPLNLHWAGVGLLALVNVYLIAQMLFLWHASSNYSANAMAQQRNELRLAKAAVEPLRGLDEKLARATEEADRFSRERLPAKDSDVVDELGALTKKAGVRLVGATYVPAVVLAGSTGELTEMRIDARLSGDYRPLVQFINALERDKMFFVIDGVTLNGQQSGTVNLRLGLTTYLRGGAPAEPAAEKTAAPANGGQGQ